jgi:protein-disulfide isomerase
MIDIRQLRRAGFQDTFQGIQDRIFMILTSSAGSRRSSRPAGRARRLRLVLVLIGAGLAGLWAADGRAQHVDTTLSRDSVLRDAEIPALGNPQGDITIVAYFDYQCPYCRKIAPDLDQVVREDGHVRLVMKDWPILGPPSDFAAQLVLATRYQGKYEASHRALIAAKGRLTETVIRDTLAGAGVDVGRAEADLASHRDDIEALLKRNNAQAEAFDFHGTPAFIVGTFRVPGVIDAAMFKRAIADARAAAAKQKK